MIVLRYALIARDEHGNKLAVVSTGREPLAGVRGRNVAPTFHRFLLSVFNMHPSATSVETVSLAGWSAGVDVESLPPVLMAAKTDDPRQLACSFPAAVEEVEV